MDSSFLIDDAAAAAAESSPENDEKFDRHIRMRKLKEIESSLLFDDAAPPPPAVANESEIRDLTEMDSSFLIDDAAAAAAESSPENDENFDGHIRKRKLKEIESSLLLDDAAPPPPVVANESEVESFFEKEEKKKVDHSEEQPDVGGEIDDDFNWTEYSSETEEEHLERLKSLDMTFSGKGVTSEDLEEEDLQDYLQGRTKEEADKLWDQFTKQAIESEGFDIDVWPGNSQYYFPCDNFKRNTLLYRRVKDMARQALDMARQALEPFQDEHSKTYELEDVEKVVGAVNREYYITFKAKNADGLVKTFQTEVFNNLGKYTVLLFRLKPTN